MASAAASTTWAALPRTAFAVDGADAATEPYLTLALTLIPTPTPTSTPTLTRCRRRHRGGHGRAAAGRWAGVRVDYVGRHRPSDSRAAALQYATQGLNPGLATQRSNPVHRVRPQERQVCYSHVRALPWTVARLILIANTEEPASTPAAAAAAAATAAATAATAATAVATGSPAL